MKINEHINSAEKDPERHTDEIQDIITKVPSWVMRRGIMVFFFVLSMVAAISVIVRYPDTITAAIHFQAIEPDTVLNSPAQAIVKQTFVKANEKISKNQPLLGLKLKAGTQFTVIAPADGLAGLVALLQPGATVQPQEQLLVIHPLQQHFFGTIRVPVADLPQLHTGQRVMVSLTGGLELTGTIAAITDEPDRNGMLTAMVSLGHAGIRIRSWMTGKARILTKNTSIAQRIWNSIVKK